VQASEPCNFILQCGPEGAEQSPADTDIRDNRKKKALQFATPIFLNKQSSGVVQCIPVRLPTQQSI